MSQENSLALVAATILTWLFLVILLLGGVPGRSRRRYSKCPECGSNKTFRLRGWPESAARIHELTHCRRCGARVWMANGHKPRALV